MIRAAMIWAAALLWTVVGLTAAAQAQDSFGQAPQPQQQNQQNQGYQVPQQHNLRQGYPQQGFGQPNAMGRQHRGGSGPLDQLAAMERRDFGVPPTSRLHAGPMHGPPPASIPGGQLITIKGLVELLRGQQMPVLDVLGGQDMIPGAQFAVPVHQAGSFNDLVQ